MSPGVPFYLFSCAGVKHSRIGPGFSMRPWVTTGRPHVKFRAIWTSFDTPTVNRGTEKASCVLQPNTPPFWPKTHQNPLHHLECTVTIVWPKTAPHLDSPSSSYAYIKNPVRNSPSPPLETLVPFISTRRRTFFCLAGHVRIRRRRHVALRHSPAVPPHFAGPPGPRRAPKARASPPPTRLASSPLPRVRCRLHRIRPPRAIDGRRRSPRSNDRALKSGVPRR